MVNIEGYISSTLMKRMKQIIGEAIMQHLDWLSSYKDQLNKGNYVVSMSLCTYESIIIHMFSLLIHKPQTALGNFRNNA